MRDGLERLGRFLQCGGHGGHVAGCRFGGRRDRADVDADLAEGGGDLIHRSGQHAHLIALDQVQTPGQIALGKGLEERHALNHPESKLVERMDYYIRPEEPETDFLRIASPEEQGYPASDIPRLILDNNLYGIEIDHRAGALAAYVDHVGEDQFPEALQTVVNQFQEANNFGSLIRPAMLDVMTASKSTTTDSAEH